MPLDSRGEDTTSLRGWLSEIYFPVLADGSASMQASLLRRLGGCATVDDPILGRASGLSGLESFICEMVEWLSLRHTTYQRLGFTMGVEHDVTEGNLSFKSAKGQGSLPVAVVAERRPSREVELRIYYATGPLEGSSVARSQLVPDRPSAILPPSASPLFEALTASDVDGAVDAFEPDGMVVDASGNCHTGPEGLRAYFASLLSGELQLVVGGIAADRKTVAVEYTLLALQGRPVGAQACLTVVAIGESGKLSAARMYHEFDLR